jgi:hypothetical protein
MFEFLKEFKLFLLLFGFFGAAIYMSSFFWFLELAFAQTIYFAAAEMINIDMVKIKLSEFFS